MRRPVLILLAACMDSVLPAARHAEANPPASSAYHIVLPRRALAPGEAIELRLEPPAPKGARVNYGLSVGPKGFGLVPPVYRAPYVIPPGCPPAKVVAGFSAPDFRASAAAEIELTPGSVAGTEDCLGPGQSWSTAMAGIEPEYLPLDVLPHLVRSVEPVYPRSAFVRGVEDTIAYRALVCRTGRVLDAVALKRYRDRATMEPVEDDPKLVEAGGEAVKQYEFMPGLAGGHPMAVWVNVHVSFRR